MSISKESLESKTSDNTPKADGKTKRIANALTAKAQKDFLLMGILLFFFAFMVLAIVK